MGQKRDIKRGNCDPYTCELKPISILVHRVVFSQPSNNLFPIAGYYSFILTRMFLHLLVLV